MHAFGRIAHKYPQWRVDLYGAGQDEELLREIIALNDMDSQVELHKPVTNIREQILDSSIFAFPSRSDGFGLVITEAMECGLPTVAMDCPCGPREILSPDTGFLVKAQDIDGYAKALEQLMTNDTLRTQMGKNAVKEVTKFYPDAIMPQWIDLFKQLNS